MSIVILGVDAPKNPVCGCFDCEIKQSCKLLKRGHIQLNGILESYRKEYCPIRELPKNHGRLIDDFKLLRALIKAFPNQSMNFYDTLERVIDEAPTIIEAEGVNE